MNPTDSISKSNPPAWYFDDPSVGARQKFRKHIRNSALLLAFLAISVYVILDMTTLIYKYGYNAGMARYKTRTSAIVSDTKSQITATNASIKTTVATAVTTTTQTVSHQLDAASSNAANFTKTSSTQMSQVTRTIATVATTPLINTKKSAKTTKVVAKKPSDKTSQIADKPSAPPAPAYTQATGSADHPATLPFDNSAALPAGVNQVQSQKGKYAYGQCTYYVSLRRNIPSNWGNANTWLTRAKAAGYLTGDIPVPGAIAQTTAGRYGHVAYVEQVSGNRVLVSEMNYNGWNKVDQRWADITSFHYIYDRP